MRTLHFISMVVVTSVLALAAFFPAGIEARASTPNFDNGTTVESLMVGGVERHYRLHVPLIYQSDRPTPLVISLHGLTANGFVQELLSQFSSKADQEGFIVAYPDGSGAGNHWNFGPGDAGKIDVEFIRQLIAAVQARDNIDPSRIYANGISNGAQMTYRLTCDLSDKIAAYGFVSGDYPPFSDCQPGRPVPIVLFHGTADRLAPYDGIPLVFMPVPKFAASWAARNGCDATPKTIYHEGDVTGQMWSSCRESADVVFYTIAGKGHSWPGSVMPAAITTRDINGADAMWDFFVAHPYLQASSTPSSS